jgi:hypothetical protein
MASKRRGGFRAPELRGTLGTLLRTTTDVVRDAFERGASAGRDVLERGASAGRARLDDVRTNRRRHDALAELGDLVLDLIRRGEIDLAELPEARDLIRQLDDIDAEDAEPELPRAITRRRFDDRAADAARREPAPSRRARDSDDGTIASGATRARDIDDGTVASGATRARRDSDDGTVASGATRARRDSDDDTVASGATRARRDSDHGTVASGATRARHDSDDDTIASGATRARRDSDDDTIASGATRARHDSEAGAISSSGRRPRRDSDEGTIASGAGRARRDIPADPRPHAAPAPSSVDEAALGRFSRPTTPGRPRHIETDSTRATTKPIKGIPHPDLDDVIADPPPRRSPLGLPHDPHRKGGISFDDDDLNEYMHPDDVPPKSPPKDPDGGDA